MPSLIPLIERIKPQSISPSTRPTHPSPLKVFKLHQTASANFIATVVSKVRIVRLDLGEDVDAVAGGAGDAPAAERALIGDSADGVGGGVARLPGGVMGRGVGGHGKEEEVTCKWFWIGRK